MSYFISAPLIEELRLKNNLNDYRDKLSKELPQFSNFVFFLSPTYAHQMGCFLEGNFY